MRVVHIITGLATGGAERALFNILYGGLCNEFDRHVISLSDEGTMGDQIIEAGVPVTALNMRSGWSIISGLKKLYRVVNEFQPDLIQGWMYHGNLVATLARTFAPGHPVLAWNIRHSLYDLALEKSTTRLVILANRLFSSAPDAIIYNSLLSRKQHESFGLASPNGWFIPNGIDVQRFRFSDEIRTRVRSELNIPAEVPVVGHVARLHPMKDHSGFLRAAADLANRHPDTHFLLSGRDVSLENTIIKQLVPEQNQDRFHLLGERNDVCELMSAMDIFCLSSAWGEGFPNVVGEAMATGVPCVVTDVGDSAIIVKNTGVVVLPQDADAFADGVELLLTMPSKSRRKLGANAQARIAGNYALDSIVDQYAELYEKLLKVRGLS